MDQVLAKFIPLYPRRYWIQYLLIWALVIWLIGALVYGIMTIKRATYVVHTERVAEQVVADNHLWNMLAANSPDQSQLGQLARTVIQLRDEHYPVAALSNYQVQPGQFAGASGVLGIDVSTATGDYAGWFTAQFIVDVLEATPGQVTNLIVPVVPPASYGNMAWQQLVAGSTAWWLLVGLADLALVVMQRRWEHSAAGKLLDDLSELGLEALALMRRIAAVPSMGRDSRSYRDASALFEHELHGQDDRSSNIAQDLADLTKLVEAADAAYKRAGNE